MQPDNRVVGRENDIGAADFPVERTKNRRCLWDVWQILKRSVN